MELSIETTQTVKRDRWPSVYAVGLSTFAVVTTEMLPVGLMMPIVSALDISVGTAGLMIAVPAILAAFFAPVVILVAGNIDRRDILSGLLVLLAAANVTSAISPSIGWLLAARVVVGFCMGGIWAIAGGLAPRLVSAQSIGPATAIIFGGVAAASVLGVPIGALIGDVSGWRRAFGTMAVFSMVVFALNLWALPKLPVEQSVTFDQFSHQLRRAPVQLGLVLTLLFVAGHFMAYTFIAPVLQTLSGMATKWIGALLFVYGAAGIIGNFLAGTIAARWIWLTLAAIGLTLATAILGFAMPGATPVSGVILLLLWGLAYGGVSVSLQTWMMRAAPSAIEIATALFVSVFNIAIAIGSFTGGQIADHLNLQTNLMIAAALPALALLFALATHRRR